MRTDKELLELAAKACGYKNLRWSPLFKCLEISTSDVNFCFDPLNDDDDALQLAATLSLDIRINQISVVVEYTSGIVTEDCKGISDLFDATRRAIVRAAAEIGATL